MKKKILLVEPHFPIPPKSKNHKNFLPIGLLKIASYLRKNNVQVKLIRGLPQNIEEITHIINFKPNEVWITSLFTYWAKHVKDAVQYYKEMFPQSKVVVGGIYASLLPKREVKKYTGCDEVYKGVMSKAEKYPPAYDLLGNSNPHSIDYQIIHASRGCDKTCRFCGTWKIELKFKSKKSIKNEIKYKKIIFYDNNFLKNLYIEDLLQELIELKKEGKISWCESQSGFDGRLLLTKPHLARMIKKAGFKDPRIAWDWKYEDYPQIKKQLDILKEAGYNSKEIYVFMVYNWDIPFEEMERKRLKCLEWKVQIADCRYRPLDLLYDNYNPHKTGQTPDEYYIHSKGGWTDSLVKQFRKNVREQNICIRHGFPFYSKSFEHKEFGKETMRKVKELNSIKAKIQFLDDIGASYWLPNQTRK